MASYKGGWVYVPKKYRYKLGNFMLKMRYSFVWHLLCKSKTARMIMKSSLNAMYGKGVK